MLPTVDRSASPIGLEGRVGAGFSRSRGPGDRLASAPLTGGFVWLAWVTEAFLVARKAAALVRAPALRQPFCERCHAWCPEKKLEPVPGIDVVGLAQSIQRGDDAKGELDTQGGCVAYQVALSKEEYLRLNAGS